MANVDDLANLAIAIARKNGAEYVDFRFVHRLEEKVSVDTGRVDEVSSTGSTGYAVRLLKNGKWGFASSPVSNKSGVVETVRKAFEVAEGSQFLSNRSVKLSPLPPIEDEYKTPIEKNPFEIPIGTKIDFLMEISNKASQYPDVSRCEVFAHFVKEERRLYSSEGRKIFQEIFQSGAGMTVTAGTSRRNRGVRSYPASTSGQYETAGWELIEELDMIGNLEKTVEEAKALTSAADPPKGVMDLVIDGPLVSLIIHESIAHALELDRVMGAEVAFSGKSYATLDKLNKLRIGSDLVNFVVDARISRGLGTFGYDDEGVKPRREYLVKDGILVGYLTSREYAQLIGRESNGSAVAKTWLHLPLIRITNVNLLPGNMSLKDLISGVDNGLYISGVRSWSIDEQRLNFQFAGQIGWVIRGGELKEVVRSPSFIGNTIDFWKSLDGIASKTHWRIWGTPNCGKGQPAQTIGTAQGASPARFRNITVGEE